MTERYNPQKSSDAYRTISEVAEELNLPQHVLRFWESRFPQVKPLKRAGGRRFYRPEDVALLRAVQALLYGEGYTIKGAQRLLAEHGAQQITDALAQSQALPTHEGIERDDREREIDPSTSGHAVVDRREPSFGADLHADPRSIIPTSTVDKDRWSTPLKTSRDVADRLAMVLDDLAECHRLLSSTFSTQN